jgi:regulatory protein
MFPAKRLTKDQALPKIKHYCSYQERSHREVTEKLYSFGLYKADVNEIMSDLIQNNYLNVERFDIQFAGGKFRMKHWGRKKIQYELQQKGVSPFIIKVALRAIDEEEYGKTLHKLAAKKWAELKGEHYLSRQSKTMSYLLQKGYEQPLITKNINELKS